MRTEKRASSYGRTVKKRLIDLEMTQAELAKMLGVGRPYLSRILSGDRSGKKYQEDIDRILSLK